ncbi:MAG: hypothetical protein IJT26_00080 [Bacteroidales bacterium]|nr:hypothetical protein [Bacteroidales bacterium]
MQLLFTLIAILLIFSFVLKGALMPRKSWVALVALAALALWFAFPWLTSQPSSAVTGVFSDRKILADVSAAVVTEAILMILFCFLRAGERSAWTLWVPEILAIPSLCLLPVLTLYALPGVDFTLFRIGAAIASIIVTAGGILLVKALSRSESEPLEALFLVNIFILLLTVAAAGAFTF